MELVLSFFCHRFPFLSDTFLEYIPLLDKMYPTVTFDKTWESALSRVGCHQSHLFRLYEEKMTPAKYPLATWSSSLIPRQIRVGSDESIKLFTVESRFPPFYNKGKIFNGNSRDFMILIIGRPSSQHFSSKNIQW